MKRDWDVIREVLLEVEQLTPEGRAQFGYGRTQTAQARSKAEHAFLLVSAGYLTSLSTDSLDGNVVIGPELTWAGHDLLDTLRSKPVWDRIKKMASEKGLELTFDVVKALGKKALAMVLGDEGGV